MSIDAEGSPSVQPQGASDTADTVHTYDIKCESDYTPPPSPELDMCVLDSELSLRERNWEITYRENWEPYESMDAPRFSVYESDLNSIRRNSAESAVDDSECMLPLYPMFDNSFLEM